MSVLANLDHGRQKRNPKAVVNGSGVNDLKWHQDVCPVVTCKLGGITHGLQNSVGLLSVWHFALCREMSKTSFLLCEYRNLSWVH